MLYCVFSGKEIIGRFKSRDKAVNYLLDCWFDGMEKVKMHRKGDTKQQVAVERRLVEDFVHMIASAANLTRKPAHAALVFA